MSTELLSERRGRVLLLTLNRPERRNALSPTLYEALRQVLEAAADDRSVGAVVLTGAGGAFSAGGDVSRMAGANEAPPPPAERIARMRERTRIGELLHGMGKPTIAMLRGPAIGAGLSIALACDLRFADTSVKLRTGFIQVGLSGDHGGHWYLPRIVGPAKARELFLLSPTLGAQEALAIGLVNRVVADAELEATVMQAATALAEGPTTAIAHMKRNLNDGLGLSLSDLLDAEAARHVACQDTADHREAARAFVEKRAPRFDHS